MSTRDWHAEREGWKVVSRDMAGNPTCWINERFNGDSVFNRTISMTHPCPETLGDATRTMPNNICFRIEYQPWRQEWLGHIWSPTGVFPGIPLTPVRAFDECELRYRMSKKAIEMGALQ